MSYLKILNHKLYGSFEDFIKYMLYKFIIDDEFIREYG